MCVCLKRVFSSSSVVGHLKPERLEHVVHTKVSRSFFYAPTWQKTMDSKNDNVLRGNDCDTMREFVFFLKKLNPHGSSTFTIVKVWLQTHLHCLFFLSGFPDFFLRVVFALFLPMRVEASANTSLTKTWRWMNTSSVVNMMLHRWK